MLLCKASFSNDLSKNGQILTLPSPPHVVISNTDIYHFVPPPPSDAYVIVERG